MYDIHQLIVSSVIVNKVTTMSVLEKNLSSCSAVTHRELSEIFTFVCFLSRWLASPAQLVVEPHEQVPDGFGAGDNVERRWQRPALVKVAHPQLGAGKLPLNVGMVLVDKKETHNISTTFFKQRQICFH